MPKMARPGIFKGLPDARPLAHTMVAIWTTASISTGYTVQIWAISLRVQKPLELQMAT
jgi:hypothetical protein